MRPTGAKMIEDHLSAAREFLPAHVNQRTQRETGCRYDVDDPDYGCALARYRCLGQRAGDIATVASR